jgi:ABC-type transport system substrate-binding protein
MWSTYVTRIDPDQLSAPYWRSDSPSNFSAYTGADELIDKARTEPDPAQRAKAYRDLQDKVSADAPAAFVISVAEGLLINKRVTGHKSAGWQERHDWFNVDVPAE